MNIFKSIFLEFQEHLSLAIKVVLFISILNAVYFGFWYIMSTNLFLLILMFMPQLMKKKYRLKIPKEFEWLLLFFVVLTFFLKTIGGVIAPIFFGVAIGFIGFLILMILYSNNQIKKSRSLMILFSFNLAVAFGFALELIKYYLKMFLGHELSVAVYTFTMKNMTYVIIGALIASVIGYFYMSGRKGFIGVLVKKMIKTNPEIFKTDASAEEILEMIKKGEGEKNEFKETLRVNVHTDEVDKRIEHAVLKTITAFLNSDGGTLLIGVSNKGEVKGIKKDRFENTDKFYLHFTNIIKEKLGKKYLRMINIQFVDVRGESVAQVDCLESDAPVFLKPTKDEEEFYIRAGPASVQIRGSELVDYIEKKFKKPL